MRVCMLIIFKKIVCDSKVCDQNISKAMQADMYNEDTLNVLVIGIDYECSCLSGF